MSSIDWSCYLDRSIEIPAQEVMRVCETTEDSKSNREQSAKDGWVVISSKIFANGMVEERYTRSLQAKRAADEKRREEERRANVERIYLQQQIDGLRGHFADARKVLGDWNDNGSTLGGCVANLVETLKQERKYLKIHQKSCEEYHLEQQAIRKALGEWDSPHRNLDKSIERLAESRLEWEKLCGQISILKQKAESDLAAQKLATSECQKKLDAKDAELRELRQELYKQTDEMYFKKIGQLMCIKPADYGMTDTAAIRKALGAWNVTQQSPAQCISAVVSDCEASRRQEVKSGEAFAAIREALGNWPHDGEHLAESVRRLKQSRDDRSTNAVEESDHGKYHGKYSPFREALGKWNNATLPVTECIRRLAAHAESKPDKGHDPFKMPIEVYIPMTITHFDATAFRNIVKDRS